MNIKLAAYYDRNFGDDMMIRIAAKELVSHELYMDQDRREFLASLEQVDNLHALCETPDVKTDCTLRVTGSYFMIRRKIFMKFTLKTIISEAMQKKKKGFKSVIGCNVGPYVNKLAEKLSIIDIKSYDLITVRDKFSYDFIKKNSPKTQVCYFPDIVFATPDEWIPPATGEELLGIVVHNNIVEVENNYNLARKLAEVCDRHTEETGSKVLIFVFDIGIETDILCACNIRSFSKHPEMLEFVLHSENGDNILKNMARCGRIISARFHGIVLALRMGIPLLPIMYSDKAYNLLDDINFAGNDYDVGDFVNSDTKTIYTALKNAEKTVLPADFLKAAEGHFKVLKDALNGVNG